MKHPFPLIGLPSVPPQFSGTDWKSSAASRTEVFIVKLSLSHHLNIESSPLRSVDLFPAQTIARVWNMASLAGGARGSLAGVGSWLMHYTGKEFQLRLQKCKPKFAAFRPSEIKRVMNTSKRMGHCDATRYSGHFNTKQHHHAPLQLLRFL